MGLSTPEWTQWMRDELSVPLEPGEIFRHVTEEISAAYREDLPLLPGAIEAVERIAERWPLAVASSSSRILIDLVLDLSELGRVFDASVSSEEVERGKPAPDVYLAAAGKLGADPTACAAVEDSTAGITSGAAAGMKVVALPERNFPPSPEALELAAVTLDSLDGLTIDLVDGLA
jgi:HAD superfamily hydrolase (TIGR01509 family)